MDETDILSALSEMSDEELTQLLRAANTPNRTTLVQQEMDRAVAGPQTRHSTPMGALGGGMAHMLRKGFGGLQQKQGQDKLEALMSGLEDPASAHAILGAVGVTPRQKILADALRQGGAGDAMLPPGVT